MTRKKKVEGIGYGGQGGSVTAEPSTYPPTSSTKPLNSYQIKQLAYVKDLVKRIESNHYDPLDVNMECKTCEVTGTNLHSVEEVEAFVNLHAGHYTWMTNNHFPTKV